MVKFALHLEDLYKYDACEEDIELFLYLAATQGSKNKLILSKYELMWLCCDSTTSLFITWAQNNNLLPPVFAPNTNFCDLDLSKLKLDLANFKASKFRNVNFNMTIFRNVNLTYTEFNNVNLKDANLAYANLAYSELRQVDLTGAYLAHANLSNTKLVDVDLTYTNLQGVNFKNSYLEDVNFERALRHREDSPIPRWKVNNNGVLQRD